MFQNQNTLSLHTQFTMFQNRQNLVNCQRMNVTEFSKLLIYYAICKMRMSQIYQATLGLILKPYWLVAVQFSSNVSIAHTRATAVVLVATQRDWRNVFIGGNGEELEQQCWQQCKVQKPGVVAFSRFYSNVTHRHQLQQKQLLSIIVIVTCNKAQQQ